MKHIKTFESFLNEEHLNFEPRIKVDRNKPQDYDAVLLVALLANAIRKIKPGWAGIEETPKNVEKMLKEPEITRAFNDWLDAKNSVTEDPEFKENPSTYKERMVRIAMGAYRTEDSYEFLKEIPEDELNSKYDGGWRDLDIVSTDVGSGSWKQILQDIFNGPFPFDEFLTIRELMNRPQIAIQKLKDRSERRMLMAKAENAAIRMFPDSLAADLNALLSFEGLEVSIGGSGKREGNRLLISRFETRGEFRYRENEYVDSLDMKSIDDAASAIIDKIKIQGVTGFDKEIKEIVKKNLR